MSVSHFTCNWIGLIECIPSKPMKSEESERALTWGRGRQDLKTSQDNFFRFRRCCGNGHEQPSMPWTHHRTECPQAPKEDITSLPETPDAGWSLGR